jgi:GR25 family glycosyltransferase involved in LPS biosynthesis
MFFHDNFTNYPIKCINLKSRRDRRQYITKIFRKKKLNVSFYKASKHENPKRGCLESHLAVIKEAIDKKYKYIFIVEDDIKLIKPFNDMKEPPTNWDMLYLGGTVKNKIASEFNNSNWVKMSCYTTHAYILNLQNTDLINDIMKAVEYKDEIDRFYIEKIHYKYNCYMINPMMIIQKADYSDIEGKVVDYGFMQSTLKGLNKPESEIDNDKNYILKLNNIEDDDLPYVSIITPTFERKHLFYLAIMSFNETYYPKNKLEWVIIDDSIDKSKSVEEILPPNQNIKYLSLTVTEKLSIAEKRNIGVHNASHDIIIHMDDDDFYPGESVLTRVKTLMKYPNINCVGSSTIGVYDLIKNKSSLSSDGDMSLSEASMGYRKSFWINRHFDSSVKIGEYHNFIQDRYYEIMDIPYSFIIIAINHNTNITNKTREVEDNTENEENRTNFYDFFDNETKLLLQSIKKRL